jgi:hypothetical protein
MRRNGFRTVRGVALALLAAAALGCAPSRNTRPYQEPPPPDLRPTRIDYADSPAFDALLESALVNQDPVILIQTAYQKPDWEGRLNAWIAAWNRGGPVAPGSGRKVRGQVPGLPQVVVDGDSIREFRLLIEGLMDRIEERAKVRSAWWAEEQIRNRRVELLRPYNLRFHRGEDGNIQIILFNGRYAEYHREFVRSLVGAGGDGEEWQRSYGCSECKHRRPEPGAGHAEGRETPGGTAGR